MPNPSAPRAKGGPAAPLEFVANFRPPRDRFRPRALRLHPGDLRRDDRAGVPTWMKQQGVRAAGWTAEYSMLPYSTHERKPRDIKQGKAGRQDGRDPAADRPVAARLDRLERLGQNTLWLDCDGPAGRRRDADGFHNRGLRGRAPRRPEADSTSAG